jgi:Insertion element 4 transposase N-terminal
MAAGGGTRSRSGSWHHGFPGDVIDDVVAAAERQAKRSDRKLPRHVMVYFAMAMALFAYDDYEEVAVRLAGTLGSWGCWGRGGAGIRGGSCRLLQARARRRPQAPATAGISPMARLV